MRKYQLLYLVCISCLFSCEKDNASPDVLTGNWELVEVYDKTTSTYIDFPQGATGSITINFNGRGQFTGKTLRNTLSNGTYSIKRDKEITFGSYTTTLVPEDELGGPFQAVLSFCNLSSSTPCSPSFFFIKNGLLGINTPLRYNIKLSKL
jgi:hypothetical protein